MADGPTLRFRYQRGGGPKVFRDLKIGDTFVFGSHPGHRCFSPESVHVKVSPTRSTAREWVYGQANSGSDFVVPVEHSDNQWRRADTDSASELVRLPYLDIPVGSYFCYSGPDRAVDDFVRLKTGERSHFIFEDNKDLNTKAQPHSLADNDLFYLLELAASE